MVHFHTLLEKRVINPDKEYGRLNNLLREEWIKNNIIPEMFKEKTLLQLINNNFLSLHCASTFTNFEDMVKELVPPDDTVKSLLLYCEILLTTLKCLKETIINAGSSSVISADKKISKNITIILEKTNHELHYINEYAVIVVKNKFTTEAIENIGNEELALELLNYNRVSLKGNIEAKRNVLKLMANHIEPLQKSKTFNGTVYTALNDNVGYYLNNFNIRHNNTEGKNKKDFLVGMLKEKLEIWYDDIYTSFVMLLIAEKELQINANLNKLKEQNKI